MDKAWGLSETPEKALSVYKTDFFKPWPGFKKSNIDDSDG